jgi:signal-transduction protein with cAMP-binding, CBS, and nucleotidyltransferase domain
MLKSNLKDSFKKEEENQQEDVKYEISEHLLSKDEEINISNIFLYHYLFHKTNENNLIFIMKKLKEIQIEENSIIFNEGDPGSCIFLIKSGTILLSSKNSKNQIILNPGTIFGELALVKNNVKRRYDAKALTNSSFYSLEKSVFQEIESNFIHKNPFKFELFNFLDEDTKDSLELLTTSLEFKKDQTITDLKGLFWIKEGIICLCDLDGNEKDIYGTDEFIGVLKYSTNKNDKDFENSTIIGDKDLNKPDMKLIAKEDVLCTVIPDFAFVEVFGLNYNTKLFLSFFKKTICQNKYFKNIIEINTIKSIIKLFSLH